MKNSEIFYMLIWKDFVDKHKDIYLELCNNHVGAMSVLDNLIYNIDEKDVLGIMQALKDMNIKGMDIYTLYNDCCQRNLAKFVLNIAALDVGVYTDAEIKENFRINNIELEIFDGKDGFEAEQQRIKFLKYMGDRPAAYPFLYDNVKLEDFSNNVEKMLQNPNSEDFVNYVKENRKYYWAYRFLQSIPGLYATDINFNGNTLNFKAKTNSNFKDVSINMNHVAEVFTTSKKFFDQRQYRDKESHAIFEWLILAKDKFLPSFAVVKNMPKEDRPKFYANGNNKRYGEIISNSKAADFLQHEGVFAISYILGLFSESGNESLKAFNFLKEQILTKLSLEDIHKLYGSINLSDSSYNKNFADFFMINFAENKDCFKNNDGTNKTAELYYHFDEIMKLRPEKEIDTTTNRKRLTPEIALEALDYILNNICYKLGLPDEYTDFVSGIAKYTSSIDSIRELISFYDRAKEINEEEVKLPLISGTYNNLNFRTLKKTDPEAYIVGYKTNCCFTAFGASASSLKHSVTSLDSRTIVVEGDATYLQGWVWFDEENGFACIDNIEGYARNTEAAIQAMIVATKKLYSEMKKTQNINKINVGLRYVIEPIKNYIYLLLKNGLVKEEPNEHFHPYCTEHKLYTDSYNQIVLADDELLLKNEFNIKKEDAPSGSQKQQ